MATYNGERFIKQQIDSILCQLNPEDELIISDDGSTDETLEIINSIQDKRIKVFN
ncbi:glycosyltransferase, partial [Treponema berlinense]|uniref:glycosyltransferase n=1 Tax=Treponema berlinense TaxID=225004 RepID=UPI003FD755AD